MIAPRLLPLPPLPLEILVVLPVLLPATAGEEIALVIVAGAPLVLPLVLPPLEGLEDPELEDPEPDPLALAGAPLPVAVGATETLALGMVRSPLTSVG